VSLQLCNKYQLLGKDCVFNVPKNHCYINIKYITLYTYVMFKNVI